MKNIALIFTAVLGIILGSCADEPLNLRPDIGINEDGAYRISSFSIAKVHYELPDGTSEVDIALTAKDGETLCFRAEVDEEDLTRRYHMRIPVQTKVDDGEYVMTMRVTDGKPVAGRLMATLDKNRVVKVSIVLPGYMLQGSGTKSDPYIIADSDDFGMFIINLGDDVQTAGAGLYFRQTGDVTPTDQSPYAPGRGYWGAPFAGYYDGGGYEIRNLYYRGSGREGSDTRFGLFTELRGSASVANVKFTGTAISGIANDSGILAGKSSGNISVENISFSGYLEGTDASYALGAVVGRQKSGTLKISNINLSASVAGHNDIGGLVGCSESELHVSDVRTSDYHFLVSGHHSVGGLIGRTKSSCYVDGARLDHKVSNEDSDIRIIEGTGTGIGGVIGTVDSSSPCFIENVSVTCPIGGGSSVGGIVGQALQHGCYLKLENCTVMSVVSGTENVGGIFGNADFSSADACRITGRDFSVRVIVDDADASVSGVKSVGGFAGSFSGKLDIEADIRINIPVNASDDRCGGAFGTISGSEVSTARFHIGEPAANPGADAVMRVSGAVSTGGFAGYITSSTITGSSSFNFSENGAPIAVPDPSRFTSVYSCVTRGTECVGGVIGYADRSSIRHIYADGRVDGQKYVGGIVGYLRDTKDRAELEDCLFNGLIELPGVDYVGGIAGYIDSTGEGVMRDCVNYASVTAQTHVGGIFGAVHRGFPEIHPSSTPVEIRWCVNKGNIVASAYVGGIAGRARVDDPRNGLQDNNTLAIKFNSCMNLGKITGSGDPSGTESGLGGIIGFSNYRTAVVSCANHGDVYAKGRYHGVGGVAGSMGDDPTGAGLTNTFRNAMLAECCNTATIDSEDTSNQLGGLLGYQEEGNKSDLQDCYNTGAIKPDQNQDTGGIVGCVDHLTNIYRCVNSGKVEHGNATIGTHKKSCSFDHGSLYFLEDTGKDWPKATKVSKADFTNQAKFNGLDFDNVWTMGTSGPELRNCPWQSRARFME